MINGPVNFGPVTDGQTDGQKAMHMSPPCISTGVLKNQISFFETSKLGIGGKLKFSPPFLGTFKLTLYQLQGPQM